MRSVLVVDDEPSSRYALSRVLSANGFEVHAAADYLGALRVVDAQPIDLLVTDIVMPKGMNGFALARMAQMRRREMKVLYVTGYDVPTDEAISRVLRKPVADEQLLEEVNRALAGTPDAPANT